MDQATRVALQQLNRMRGMTAMYHRRFFLDINIATVLSLGLLLAGWTIAEEAFLLVPVVALIGAVQTAFDASYLIFARTYAARLEDHINRTVGSTILVGAALEDTYLFPLGARKVVAVPVNGGFTWFSFVTVFYTVIGAATFAFGLALGWDGLVEGPALIATAYLMTLAALTIGALAFGTWWFVGGEGERKLTDVLDERFGKQAENR